MPTPINKQVLGLKIPINDTPLMHVANGHQYLDNVEHGNVVTEPAVLSETVEELPPGTVLEDHVDEDVVLEGGFEAVDERVV